MLAGGTDPIYRRVLAAGHTHFVRIEVWSGQGVHLDTLEPMPVNDPGVGVPEGGLVFLDGTVTATLTSRVSRNLSLSVPMYMYPVADDDLLQPFGNEIRAYLGVRLGDGSSTYTWQVFRGRIRTVEQDSAGTCTVLCSDRAADVQDVNFTSPQNSNAGDLINEEFQRLIVQAIPDATFGASDIFSKAVEPMTWEVDRAGAIDEMARSVGALWYPLANGDFVIRRFPWTVLATPVIALTDAPGGTVNSWRARRSRDSIFNVVTVAAERLNGDAPVYATATDATAGSPTSVGGNFGIRSRVERLQTPSTVGGAMAAAEALLRTYISPVEEWMLQVVPDASQELGDAIQVNVNGRSVLQVVTGISLPLGPSGDMTISTRSLVIGGAS